MEPLRGSLSLGQRDLEPSTKFQSLVAVDVGDDEAAPAAESHASPDELRRRRLTECGRRRVKGLLVHGSRLPMLLVRSDPALFQKRFPWGSASEI
jgi:hypothetical protein